jgi:hypothetical protein
MQAMAQLYFDQTRDRRNYPFLSCQGCGILFLGTPHHGSSEADWNPLPRFVAEVLFGFRMEAITNEMLSSFNSHTVKNATIWEEIPCPFECLVESRKTRTKKGRSEVQYIDLVD